MMEIPDWEKEQGLPENIEYVRHTGSRCYYESFAFHNSHLTLLEHKFADYGDQFNEEVFEDALERISRAAIEYPETRFWHIRYDHEDWFDESPDNTSYKLIDGHGNVKLTRDWLLEHNFLEEGGIWYYCGNNGIM